MISKPVALIRTDGNAQIGYGHVMRMLALAHIISSDFDILFLTKTTDGWIKKQVENQFKVIEVFDDSDFSWAEQIPSESKIIILDGYQFNTLFQNALKAHLQIPIISIDDYQPFAYETDAVINHAGLLGVENFSLGAQTTVYAGTQYALLRNVYNEVAKEEPRRIKEVNSAFICLGGTDPNYYYEIINKLKQYNIGNYFIVVNQLDKFEELRSIKGTKLFSNLDALSLIDLMKKSDIAVLPASTLSYEYCSVKGGLFIIQTADNQKNIFNFLIKSGCAFDFQCIDDVFKTDYIASINKQIEIQKQFFNGRNEEHLKKLIFNIAFKNKLHLRRATKEDLMLYYKWANDPVTRSNSFNKDFISLESHISWFENMLKKDTSVLYVLVVDNACLGSIRFDMNGQNALLSYSIDKNYRGKGLGTVILELGIRQICKDFPTIKKINGYIHKNNIASIASFKKVGFLLDLYPDVFYPDFNYYTHSCK